MIVSFRCNAYLDVYVLVRTSYLEVWSFLRKIALPRDPLLCLVVPYLKDMG